MVQVIKPNLISKVEVILIEEHKYDARALTYLITRERTEAATTQSQMIVTDSYYCSFEANTLAICFSSLDPSDGKFLWFFVRFVSYNEEKIDINSLVGTLCC